MAVERDAEAVFEARPEVVARAVRTILSQSPPYAGTSELDPAIRFRTNVRPHWWLLGTEMTIELQPGAQGTRVSVSTKSQWFILGDLFDYYGRSIRDFLATSK